MKICHRLVDLDLMFLPAQLAVAKIGDIILEVAGSGLEATAICNTVDKINTRYSRVMILSTFSTKSLPRS